MCISLCSLTTFHGAVELSAKVDARQNHWPTARLQLIARRTARTGAQGAWLYAVPPVRLQHHPNDTTRAEVVLHMPCAGHIYEVCASC